MAPCCAWHHSEILQQMKLRTVSSRGPPWCKSYETWCRGTGRFVAVEGYTFPSGSGGRYLPLLGDLGGGDFLEGMLNCLGTLALVTLAALTLLLPSVLTFLGLLGTFPIFFWNDKILLIQMMAGMTFFCAFNSSQIMDALKLILPPSQICLKQKPSVNLNLTYISSSSDLSSKLLKILLLKFVLLHSEKKTFLRISKINFVIKTITNQYQQKTLWETKFFLYLKWNLKNI